MTDQFAAPSDKPPGEFRRSAYGAPIIVGDDGKRSFYRRASGYAVDPSPYNLLKWKERQLVMGVLTMLGDEVHAIDMDDRDAIDRLIADAYRAADADLAADRGTHVHTLTEHADRTGHPPTPEMIEAGEVLGIPAPLQQHVVASWLAFRAALGVTAAAVELPVVNDDHRAAGTLDRIDEIGRPILTQFGTLQPGDRIVGDIKTGSLATHADGHPRYWVKYGPQLVIYAGGTPYDVDLEKRLEWDPHPPRRDIALLYHYDLAAAIDGETVEWQVIPVNLHAARIGVEASAAVHEYAKRRDIFGQPVKPAQDSTRRRLADAESHAARRERLLERYRQLADVDQARFRALGVERDDLDAVEQALDEVDPFCRVVPAEGRKRGGS